MDDKTEEQNALKLPGVDVMESIKKVLFTNAVCWIWFSEIVVAFTAR